MRIEDLRYFIRVAESGSVSQVAQSSYITQQGLRRIIGSVENELGLKLFRRSSKAMKLTAAGEAVLGSAQEVEAAYLKMLERASAQMIQRDGADILEFIIYATPVICITVLPRILGTLSLHFPAVHFNVVEKLPLEIANEVELDEHSMGIVSISHFLRKEAVRLNNETIRFDTFYEDRLQVSASMEHPLARQSAVTTQELASLPLVLHNTETLMAQHLMGEDFVPSAHTTNHRLCEEIVAKGVAVGLTSNIMDYYFQRKDIVSVPLEKGVEISYGCMYQKETEPTPLQAEIRAMVKGELKQVSQAMEHR